jgi:uncharacterized transporter YbjL
MLMDCQHGLLSAARADSILWRMKRGARIALAALGLALALAGFGLFSAARTPNPRVTESVVLTPGALSAPRPAP